MNNSLSLLPDIPHARLIWLILVAIPMSSVVYLTGRSAWLLACDLVRASARREHLATTAADRTRYAEEVSVAAQRTAANAEHRRQSWLAALAAVDRSYRALEAAESKVRTLAEAAALPTPRTPSTPAEYAQREKYLHRAAMAACARGDLSIYQLSDALANRNGWDPRLHPANQELVLRRAIREHVARRHAEVIAREYETWQAYESAAAAAQSLRHEALMAAWRAQRMHTWLRSAPDSAVEVTQMIAPPRAVPHWQPVGLAIPTN